MTKEEMIKQTKIALYDVATMRMNVDDTFMKVLDVMKQCNWVKNRVGYGSHNAIMMKTSKSGNKTYCDVYEDNTFHSIVVDFRGYDRYEVFYEYTWDMFEEEEDE